MSGHSDLGTRRRIARARAAWHLLRYGSVIYGCHFARGIPLKAAPRPVLLTNNYVQHELSRR